MPFGHTMSYKLKRFNNIEYGYKREGLSCENESQ